MAHVPLFALPPGHGQATCSGDPADPAAWRFDGPLAFPNPEALGESSAFKPFVVLDATSPLGFAVCDEEFPVHAWALLRLTPRMDVRRARRRARRR